MSDFALFRSFEQLVAAASDETSLSEALNDISAQMGFSYFALTHHVDFAAGGAGAIRVHNYPAGWEEWFDRRRLGPADPVHRATHRTLLGFSWDDLPRLVRLTSDDRSVLDEARRNGIGDGFTVPAHVPGEAFGSCSFATQTGRQARRRYFPLAQLAGALAFEAARRMASARLVIEPVVLTERQRQCVRWLGRGKSDWEISQIIGVSHETVVRHVKQARDRYGVERRTALVARALFDEQISFADLFP